VGFLGILFRTQGRIGRLAYICGTVLVELSFFLISKTGAIETQWMDGVLNSGKVTAGHAVVSFSILIIGAIWFFSTLWAMFAVGIKRWHDRGKSGWWILIWLIPVVGAIWALVECCLFPGTRGANKYGPPPDTAVNVASVFS
jgi:uncharacterized membrane protein YhaH (DUF805 family)